MSDESDERENDLDERTDDTAHGFDQTNGMVDGLEGDADEPGQDDAAPGSGNGLLFAAPAPGTQVPPGIVPAVTQQQPDADADTEAEDPHSPGA